MHRRPLSVLIAAAVTIATVAGGSAANAATPSGSPALTRAAAEARSDASAALAGLRLPAPTVGMRAAAAKGDLALPLDSVLHVTAAKKRYDIHVTSTGAKTDRTSIQLFLGTHSERITVRRLVRVTVIRHGYKHPLLETVTTFKRFVVMMTGLQGTPIGFKAPHFATRSAFVAALAHGLAVDDREANREYGALLRFVQMSLDLSASLLQAAVYLEQHPTVTDFSAVPTVQTIAGSGGYAGTVTLTGSMQAFTASVVNTTDTSSLTESLDATALTITYTVGGKTYTESISFAS